MPSINVLKTSKNPGEIIVRLHILQVYAEKKIPASTAQIMLTSQPSIRVADPSAASF